MIRGPESCSAAAKSEFGHYLHHLIKFEAIGAGGHDYGVSVRIRSQALATLLSNPELLQQQRAAAAARSRSLYGGYSRDDMIRHHQQQHTGEVLGCGRWEVGVAGALRDTLFFKGGRGSGVGACMGGTAGMTR